MYDSAFVAGLYLNKPSYVKMGPTYPPIQCVPGALSPGDKAAGE